MGWLTSGLKFGASLLGSVAKVTPGLSTVVGAASLGFDAYNALKPSPSNTGIGPPLGGLPALPGMNYAAAGLPTTTGGIKTIHSSPVVPTDKASIDAWISAGLIVPYNKLRPALRAPRGYRVVHVNGITVGMRADIARRLHLVGPTHKPPISVGQWHALKKAGHTIKVLNKVEKEAKKLARFATKGHHHLKALPAPHKRK